MKKKPSLLDIELFAQERTTENQKELLKIEEESDAAVFESLAMDEQPEDVDLSTESFPEKDHQVIRLIEITENHNSEINKLKQELFKVKEQLRVYHSFLSSQQKKITELENRKMTAPGTSGVVDANYTKLLLKNVVWLREEKEFTANDVARLFRAEGFQTPHPHEKWDANLIDKLYQSAKKTFL
ncbi:hypothetical protein MTBBW1_350030 [Desulfamplus magnetovallimortis]|uniref:Uncharacterized protein n=1 Tax=Desulfamplus magnetovallimortis TaxID=1246637 RepID=A0A1W1HGD0_9BACT|nr:hypothetical protein [Desulfamplus magnetovallimortis]SLM31539.1 hypothetical protein MTBBW1_350030 [Desulfamplus magnetovallimortis]